MDPYTQRGVEIKSSHSSGDFLRCPFNVFPRVHTTLPACHSLRVKAILGTELPSILKVLEIPLGYTIN